MSAIDYADLDCKLFVSPGAGVETVEDLVLLVGGLLGGTQDHRLVEADRVGLIVSPNGYADGQADPDGPDAFLNLPFLVEVYFASDAGHRERVQLVTQLLALLRARQMIVVPACDYEDELPA